MKKYVDERDGNKYKVIKIGNLYWFAENLRYQEVLHYAPNDDTDNIDKYGCLYTWKDAMKACPKGWRLPTEDEFEESLELPGSWKNSSSIRSSDWKNGSNDSEFSALPAGRRWDYDCFDDFGSGAYFWSSTPFGEHYIYCLEVTSGYVCVESYGHFNALSVRCVKSI